MSSFGAKAVLSAIALAWCLAAQGSTSEPIPAEYDSIKAIAQDLYEALTPAQRSMIDSDPLILELAPTPFVKPAQSHRGAKLSGVVVISTGFIDLIRNLSCARAEDLSQRGFFDRYSLSLGRETASGGLAPLSVCAERNSWPIRKTNEQLTHFNQMAGTVLAIELAHHYLGHYQSHKHQLTDSHGNSVPINSVLTTGEWNDAVKAAALNSLNCGLATEGIKSLFQCLGKMPQRPAWTLYFAPEKARFSQLNRKLDKLEATFFR